MLRKLFWVAFWLVTAAGVTANAVWAATDPMWRQVLVSALSGFTLGAALLTAGVGLGLLWKRLLSGDDRHDAAD